MEMNDTPLKYRVRWWNGSPSIMGMYHVEGLLPNGVWFPVDGNGWTYEHNARRWMEIVSRANGIPMED